MSDRLEALIKRLYRGWKAGFIREHKTHPGEDAIVSFAEGRLPAAEARKIAVHLASCGECSEELAVSQKLAEEMGREVPAQLVAAVQALVRPLGDKGELELIIRLKDRALDILSATGDILVGDQFIPAAVFRSRKSGSLKDKVVILKDFKDIRVEAKIEAKNHGSFNLSVSAKEKKSQRIIPGLRITLLKDGLELESYLEKDSAAVFENIPVGKYAAEISSGGDRLASIILDMRNQRCP